MKRKQAKNKKVFCSPSTSGSESTPPNTAPTIREKPAVYHRQQRLRGGFEFSGEALMDQLRRAIVIGDVAH